MRLPLRHMSRNNSALQKTAVCFKLLPYASFQIPVCFFMGIVNDLFVKADELQKIDSISGGRLKLVSR